MDLDTVKDYYTTHLNKSDDLKTNACCTRQSYPDNIKKLISNIHEDITNSYYGCGLVIPDCLEKCNVLDLGCGTGFDVYILSQLVGEDGKVFGVDMTEKQLKVANTWKEWHRNKFNYKESNIEFLLGYIELLNKLNIANNSIDVVISNCVINLCLDKEAVLRQVYNVLKMVVNFILVMYILQKEFQKNLKKIKYYGVNVYLVHYTGMISLI